MALPLHSLLLAAGEGTRLRPITTDTPKCLVKIKDQPLLGWWFDQLEGLGCQAVRVNTHHLAEQVQSFINNRACAEMSVETVFEPKLLGTAGSLFANKDFFAGSTGLLIHADNVTCANLKEFLLAHETRPTHCLLTMLTFTTTTPQSCGIVEIDQKGVVTSFHEKSANPPGTRANGAIYLFDGCFLDWLGTIDPSLNDFSTQIIPKLLCRIYTWHTESFYCDIGTPASLREAQLKMRNIF